MYKDPKLEELYETVLKNKLGTYGYDIWNEEVLTEIKINYFFNRMFETTILFELFSKSGDVNVIYEKKPINGGFEFKFENNTNETKYYTIVTVFKTEYYSDKLDNVILNLLSIGKSVDKITEIKTLLDNNKDKYLISFRFEDENQLTNLTGKMENKAGTVFSNVYRNIRNVLHRKEFIFDVIMYSCLVNKLERNRITLYSEIMKRTIRYNHNFIDTESNNKYDILYFW